MSGWAAAAQAASSLAGSYLQYKGQKTTNAANREMVAMANAFTERMSNSAYQRAMADMKKAGLNPILAYQQGGAQTPQSAMLSMQNPYAGMAHSLGSAASSAFDVYSSMSKLPPEVDKIKSEIGKIKSETWRTQLQSLLVDAQESKTTQEIKEVIARTRILEENFNEAQATGELYRDLNQSELDSVAKGILLLKELFK